MTNLLPRDGVVRLIPAAIAPADADRLFRALQAGITWQQQEATVMGRRVRLPRLTAWYGEAGYVYSGVRHAAAPWTPDLLQLKDVAEAIAEAPFNSVLLNLYRDGRDSVSWHADDEPGLGPAPLIASLSLGAARRFQLRHRATRETIEVELGHGAGLVMAGATQRSWRHQVPKTARLVGPRINLTFRRMAAR